jgi:hypothetical protein
MRHYEEQKRATSVRQSATLEVEPLEERAVLSAVPILILPCRGPGVGSLVEQASTAERAGGIEIMSFSFGASNPTTVAMKQNLGVKLSDVLVSGWSLSSGGDRPTESLSLNFTKITYSDLQTATAAEAARPGKPIYVGNTAAAVKNGAIPAETAARIVPVIVIEPSAAAMQAAITAVARSWSIGPIID